MIFPFDNVDERGFDTVYPPETEIDFEKEYIGKDGRKIGWFKTNRRGENVFSNVPEDDVTGYALTYLESDRDQKLSLISRFRRYHQDMGERQTCFYEICAPSAASCR